jgi:3-oxoacyl-[acyl-carrier protein] reductase
MNVAQEIVARLYVAAPEVSDPPEVIGPADGAANPGGKSVAGSSADSSWVPVSWPDAAASGVIDAVGGALAGAAAAAGAVAAPVAAVPVVAAPALDAAAADGAVAAAEDTEDEDVHPATASSTPAMTPSTPTARRSPRKAVDDIALPTPRTGPQHLTTYLPLSRSAVPPAVPSGIMSQEHRRSATARRAEEGKANVMPQRIAIVTGAARGIGAGTAMRLAADGMAVAVLDLNEEDGARTVGEIEEAGGKAIAVGADVSNSDQVTAAVEKVVADLGEPTVLVNNAGVTRDNLLFKMSEADWDTVMNVHLKGAFLMTRATQQYMVAAKWGRIVNLSSLSAVGNRGQVNYSAAKAGMQGFTKTLALELGKFGITANAVAPGFVVTDMTAATAARLGVSFEDFQAGAARQIPVQRVGQVEDIAHAISFFVSEGAGFVSGQILYLSGGPVS